MSDTFFDQEVREDSKGFALDPKRVLARAIRFWYVVVLFLAGALAIAFYTNRYSERVYPVNTSILIREAQEMGGAELLYKNALIDPYRNYLNEPYIIRSQPLIEKVVRDLNFQISFYREGYVITTEAYDYIPVKATWCDPGPVKTGRFVFTLVDNKHYTLESFSNKENEKTIVHTIGDSIRIGDYNLCIKEIPERNIENFVDLPFIMTISNPSNIAISYSSRLNVVWAELGAGVIDLSITGTNPEKEIDFLNALIKEYGQRDLNKKNEAASRTIEFIQSQLIEIKDSLRVVEFQLERFGNSSRLKDMSTEAQRLFSKLENFELQRAELLISQNYYKYLEGYLGESEGLDQVILPSSVGLSDPVLTGLLNKMVELQLEMKIYGGRDGVMNPIVSSRMERINNIKKDIAEAVHTLRSTDEIKMNFLKKQLSDAEKQLSVLPSSERQLIGIQRNYSLLENLYVFLMQKLSEASISMAANTSDIIPVNPPRKGSALSPKPTNNYVIATIAGLAIPVILFILFELVNNKVQSKEDIEKMTSIPFIGGVGHNTTDSNLTVKDKSKSGIAESFRALRSNLNYFTNSASKKIFMVSSSISGEGKTFTTINLATVFALSDKKTLIVGADMRRPKIFEDFDLHNDTGLSTYLSGLSTFEEVVQPTSIANLYMISGGPVPPNPSELLLTDQFDVFIKRCLEEFEFIIIDTPPLALVTDAFVISKYA
ncbi:MAG: polysaccharide biosynthesis tyrosine autokinase, partial [Cyclobacteriaceae bacterium]